MSKNIFLGTDYIYDVSKVMGDDGYTHFAPFLVVNMLIIMQKSMKMLPIETFDSLCVIKEKGFTTVMSEVWIIPSLYLDPVSTNLLQFHVNICCC